MRQVYEDFVPERIAKLRIQKGVSARDMSLSLGQANNYINNIENKKSLPSMHTPLEFFDEGNDNPEALQQFIEEGRKLSPEAMQHILHLMKDLNNK